MSGKVNNEEHSSNIPVISISKFVFHFEISGNEINDEHPLTYISSLLLD